MAGQLLIFVCLKLGGAGKGDGFINILDTNVKRLAVGQGAIAGGHDNFVDIVAIGIGRVGEFGCADKVQPACRRIDREARCIGAAGNGETGDLGTIGIVGLRIGNEAAIFIDGNVCIIAATVGNDRRRGLPGAWRDQGVDQYAISVAVGAPGGIAHQHGAIGQGGQSTEYCSGNRIEPVNLEFVARGIPACPEHPGLQGVVIGIDRRVGG